MRLLPVLTATLLASTALASPAWAADPLPAAPDAPAAVADDGATEMGDIVVTANKRSTNVQDVPLSISVVGGQEIADRQIRDGIAIARETPNLQAESVMGAAMPRFRLRGIGTNDFLPTATSAVGIYEDEVYLSAGAAQSQPLYDLDRVEVLRGPQGSLWGKNTTAGAIHYVTARPGFTTSGQARLVYGSDDTREAEAAIGTPLSDTFAVRAAGVYRHRDGQYRNDFTGEKAGAYDIWDARGEALWRFTPNASLLVKVHGGESEQDQPLQHIGLLAGGADSDGYVERDPSLALSNNGSGYTRARRLGASAHLDVDLGGATLTDIFSWERSSSLVFSDDDANPIARYHERYGGSSNTFTQELRIASPDHSRFGWIVGGYYLHDKTNSFGQLGLYSPVNFGVDGAAYDFDVTTDNVAGFVSLSYEITPRLKVTVGGRYTWERKANEGVAYDYVTQGTDVFDASVPNLVYIDTRQGIYLDATGAPMASTPKHRAWGRATWDGSVDYKLTTMRWSSPASRAASGRATTTPISPCRATFRCTIPRR